MHEDLLKAVIDMLRFNSMDPKAVTNVEHNCGTIWFDYGGEKFSLSAVPCEPEEDIV